MKKLKVENFYREVVTSSTAILATGDFTIDVSSPPINDIGFLILGSEDAAYKQIFFYYEVSGNTITVRGENRITAAPVTNPAGLSVKMNDVAEIFNYYGDNISNCFYIEKNGGLGIKVYGGYVLYNSNQIEVADTVLTLTNNATNYIKYNPVTNTISATTTPGGNIKAVVICTSGVITEITYRVSKEVYHDASIELIGALPPLGGNAGYSLHTDGVTVFWGPEATSTTSTKGLIQLASSLQVAQGTLGGAYAINPLSLSDMYYFGDGSDGNVTITTNTTLTRDMYYNDLTVDTGVTLNPAGYAVYVLGTLTLTGTAKIARNGNNGASTTGGAALATGTCGPCLGGGNGGSAGTGIAGGNGTNGTAVAVSYKTTGSSAAGGNGGAGTNPAGTGGTAASHTQGALYNKIHTLSNALQIVAMPSRVLSFTQYGGLASSGGGGGGGSVATGIGGAGGGAGGNGGIIMVFANTIAGTGTLEAIGGAGANGANGSGTNQGGGGGGGGGGNGGVVVLVYRTGTVPTLNVAGGAPGTFGTGVLGGASGTAGNTGTSGQTIVIDI